MEATNSPDKRHGGEIRRRRLELGWTQQRLATEAGISVATLRKLESGTQAAYRQLTVVPLCRALGWPPNALDGLTPDSPDSADSPDSETAPSPSTTDTPGAADGTPIAAFSGELANLTAEEMAAIVDFVRQLRAR